MAALETLYNVHQCTCVNGLISRNIGVSRKVAEQPEQSCEPCDAGMGIARYNRFLHEREMLPIIFPRKLEIRL